MLQAPPPRRTRSISRLERHLNASSDGTLRLVLLADSHSKPHPRALESVGALRPDAIVHAGDIGDLRVVESFAAVSPVLAVRGNIDGRGPTLPDVLVLQIDSPRSQALRIVVIHIGVNGPRLRADAARLARSENAAMVVCGHSHVPFIGRDRGIIVFNPGSIGPRRFSLPIVFGVMDLGPHGIALRHVDCETGQSWIPPSP